jgi:hypothetical protein
MGRGALPRCQCEPPAGRRSNLAARKRSLDGSFTSRDHR